MKFTSKSDFGLRRLPVRWLESPVIGPLDICRRNVRRPEVVRAPCRGIRSDLRSVGRNFGRAMLAFTLLELMMVITIIGFIAALALPHVGGIGQSNSMTAATRQLLDDVAFARQRAMVNRSTVYMVFLPPMFWTNNNFNSSISDHQMTNLMAHQYSAYALVSLTSVGDQPGQHYPRYLSDWRVLPNGVFFAPFEFSLTNNLYVDFYTTNTLAGTIYSNAVYGWNSVSGVPFPSTYGPNTTTMPLPCIGFTPQGSLNTPYINQYIALARGSIFYPTDTNGVPLEEAPNVAENPPGNDSKNPNLIQIDWMTGRATLVQNQLQ